MTGTVVVMRDVTIRVAEPKVLKQRRAKATEARAGSSTLGCASMDLQAHDVPTDIIVTEDGVWPEIGSIATLLRSSNGIRTA